jgi:hypothetical protein
MTDGDRDACFVLLRQMGAAQGKKLAPDAMEMYFRILQRKFVPLSVLKKAIIMALEAERLMPRISTLLAYCDKARDVIQTKALPPGSPELEAVSWCSVCGDTGWEPFFCPGQGEPYYLGTLATLNSKRHELAECSWVTLRKPHEPHPFVSSCSCRPTNPVYFRAHPVRPRTFGGLPETGRL